MGQQQHKRHYAVDVGRWRIDYCWNVEHYVVVDCIVDFDGSDGQPNEIGSSELPPAAMDELLDGNSNDVKPDRIAVVDVAEHKPDDHDDADFRRR